MPCYGKLYETNREDTRYSQTHRTLIAVVAAWMQRSEIRVSLSPWPNIKGIEGRRNILFPCLSQGVKLNSLSRAYRSTSPRLQNSFRAIAIHY